MSSENGITLLLKVLNEKTVYLLMKEDLIIGRNSGTNYLSVRNRKGKTLCWFSNTRSLDISRSHLMLRFTKGELYAEDLGSTNGTKIDGKMIEPNTPIKLKQHSDICLGCAIKITLEILNE